MSRSATFPSARKAGIFGAGRGVPSSRTADAMPLSATEALIVRCVTIMLASTMLLQKLAIPFSGESQIQFVLPLNLAFFGYLVAMRCAFISAPRLLLWMATLAIAFLNHLFFVRDEFSVPSLLFYAVIYSLYIFVLPVSWACYEQILKNFSKIALFVCGMVAMNWAVQIAGRPLPSIETIMPFHWTFNYYMYVQPLQWGSAYVKPNALFFLETSHVSQFLGFALIIEICILQRIRYMAIFGGSLLATFGGTGLLMVLLCAPFILFYLKPKFLLALAVGAPLAFGAAAGIGLLDNIQHRSTEFSREGSSGNQRFIAPVEAIVEAASGRGDDLLFGIGAGNMPRAINIAWNPASKVFKEYGIIFFSVWFVFMIYGIFGRGVPFVIGWAVFVQYHLLNGSFLVPLNSVYCVLLSGAYFVQKPFADNFVRGPVVTARAARYVMSRPQGAY